MLPWWLGFSVLHGWAKVCHSAWRYPSATHASLLVVVTGGCLPAERLLNQYLNSAEYKSKVAQDEPHDGDEHQTTVANEPTAEQQAATRFLRSVLHRKASRTDNDVAAPPPTSWREQRLSQHNRKVKSRASKSPSKAHSSATEHPARAQAAKGKRPSIPRHLLSRFDRLPRVFEDQAKETTRLVNESSEQFRVRRQRYRRRRREARDALMRSQRGAKSVDEEHNVGKPAPTESETLSENEWGVHHFSAGSYIGARPKAGTSTPGQSPRQPPLIDTSDSDDTTDASAQRFVPTHEPGEGRQSPSTLFAMEVFGALPKHVVREIERRRKFLEQRRRRRRQAKASAVSGTPQHAQVGASRSGHAPSGSSGDSLSDSSTDSWHVHLPVSPGTTVAPDTPDAEDGAARGQQVGGASSPLHVRTPIAVAPRAVHEHAVTTTGFFFPQLEDVYDAEERDIRRHAAAVRRRKTHAARERLQPTSESADEHRGGDKRSAGDDGGHVAGSVKPTQLRDSPQQQQRTEQQQPSDTRTGSSSSTNVLSQPSGTSASKVDGSAAVTDRRTTNTLPSDGARDSSRLVGVPEDKVVLAIMHFRRGRDGQVYFLYCSLLETTTKHDRNRNLLSSPRTLNTRQRGSARCSRDGGHGNAAATATKAHNRKATRKEQALNALNPFARYVGAVGARVDCPTCF